MSVHEIEDIAIDIYKRAVAGKPTEQDNYGYLAKESLKAAMVMHATLEEYRSGALTAADMD